MIVRKNDRMEEGMRGQKERYARESTAKEGEKQENKSKQVP